MLIKSFIFFTLYIYTCSAIIDFKDSLLIKNSNLSQKNIKLFEKIYNVNNYEKTTVTHEARIPKIIHQIWIGSKVPKKYHLLMETWKKKHPDWTFKLWTDEDINNFPFINKKAFDDAKNYGLKSDIWRIEILFYYGGLYVDTDFECIKPFDILHHSHDFYVGLICDVIPNGIIGSIPKHPILQKCIKTLKNAKINEKSNPMEVSGPYFFTKIILNYLQTNSDNGLCIYPNSFFFPFPATLRQNYWKGKISRKELESFFKKESFAVHLWATSWQ